MATWSFNPSLTDGITYREDSSGKLIITVPSRNSFRNTAYTVTYKDGTGCSASTRFTISKNCSENVPFMSKMRAILG